MSRTKRHIPYWAKSVRPYEKTWIGLYGDKFGPYTGDNPRNRLENGYDGPAQSYIYLIDGWKECPGSSTRRYCKRHRAKSIRRYYKEYILRELHDGDAEHITG